MVVTPACQQLRRQWYHTALLWAGVWLSFGVWLSTVWPYSRRWLLFSAPVLAYGLWLLWRHLPSNHRDGQEILLPTLEERLAIGDCILFCGGLGAQAQVAWTVSNPNVLEYVETGEERPDGYVWRWLAQRRERRDARAQST